MYIYIHIYYRNPDYCRLGLFTAKNDQQVLARAALDFSRAFDTIK